MIIMLNLPSVTSHTSVSRCITKDVLKLLGLTRAGAHAITADNSLIHGNQLEANIDLNEEEDDDKALSASFEMNHPNFNQGAMENHEEALRKVRAPSCSTSGCEQEAHETHEHGV